MIKSQTIPTSATKLIIFDLDGTLTSSGQPLEPPSALGLAALLRQTAVAVISGATFQKMEFQILAALAKNAKLENLLLLPQNGSHCFENQDGVWRQVYGLELSPADKEKVLAALEKVSELEKPAETYPPLVADKGGQITYSPVGIDAPAEAKTVYDPDHRKRQKIAEVLRGLLPDFEIGIGGRSSIDITNQGINKGLGVAKVLALKAVSPNEAVFVGDALFPGGNDEPVKATGLRVFAVKSPAETAAVIAEFIQSPFYDFDIKSEGVLLQKTDRPFESRAVLNPACVEKDGLLHIFYRAVAADNVSTIGYCAFKDAKPVKRLTEPLLAPEFDYESRGLEDPEIVLVDGVYYLFYTAYDGRNARVAYAESRDLVNFEKRGLISAPFTYAEVLTFFNKAKLPERYFWYGRHYQEAIAPDVLLWEKDFSLFPEKIGGRFALLHRVMPGIQIVFFDDFADLKNPAFWREHFRTMENYIVLDPERWFETKKIGGGAPPVKTPDGWLLIYHAVEEHTRIYRTGAALLDLHDPRKVIGRLEEPLFSPVENWEKEGLVANVVFATSALRRGDRLHVYYGAADSLIAAKSLDFNKLLGALKIKT